MNHLKFEFSATECNGWPNLQFFIDDDLYQDYEFLGPTAEVTLPIDLLDGEHLLEIELYGKTFENTKVENDQIIADQLVTLDCMYIDDIQLPDMFKYSGRYEHCPDQISLTWGINGKWSFEFATPIVPWAVTCKLNEENKYNDYSVITSAHSYEKNNKLLEILDHIEQELGNVKI